MMMKRTILTITALCMLLLIAGQNLYARKVKFSLDLTGVTPNTTGVHVSGDFQEAAGFAGGNWQPGTTVLENEPGTNFYSIVVDIPAWAKYEYKFLNGDQWYDVEFVPVESRVGYDFNDNRWFYLDSLSADTTLIGPIPFSGNAPAGQYLLRFRVDMQLLTAIDPAGVHVAGNYQGWDPAEDMMYSFDGNVYEYIAYVDQAEPGCMFRYVNGNTEAGYETVPGWCASEGNRFITLSEDTVLNTVCFSYCSDCSTTGTAFLSDPPSKARIYPNPANSRALLEFNDSCISHDIIITDLPGKVHRSYINYKSEALSIDRNGLSEGIYLVTVSSGGKWLCTVKLFITND